MTRQEYAEHADETYVETVKSVAQSIRNVADEFERDALRAAFDSAVSNRGPRTLAVVRALHALHWGVANASIERVVREAVEADHAERLMRS